MELKNNIAKLVENFIKQNALIQSEEHIQTFFTIELLKLIGYDSSNVHINKGQDVKTGKRPDLLLHNSGSTVIVVESKDASKKEMLDGKYKNKSFEEQLFDYCSAEGVYWGILTNFVEWRVYSVYQKRLYRERKYAFHDLLWKNSDKSDYIDILSKEGLEFLKQLSKENIFSKKGQWDDDPIYYPKQEEIKEKFFQDLKRWRSCIRTFLSKKYNAKYSTEQIDLITQKLIDRLIFTDYCSDNGIITQDKLHAILYSKSSLHNELKNIFSFLNEKFNSELFSKGNCDDVEIDNDVLSPIIKELADTNFRKLSVHVIGEVYENYLGELLNQGKKNDDKVIISDEKFRRKSHGIYYTPEYIVNYITENSVGNLLKKCRTIDEIEKIRVIDMACGSGSFLIRVFDEFLKHYKRIYNDPLFEFEIRKRILQKNIFGVDIDERAIEIAKLNLLVKAMENSSHLDLSGTKLLPNLKLNIRCGNSLISGETTFKEIKSFWRPHIGQLKILNDLHLAFHDEKDYKKQEKIFNEIQEKEFALDRVLNENLGKNLTEFENLKSINFSVLFPTVFINGGFDCAVGNPPYIKLHNIDKKLLEFAFTYYKTAEKKCDIYAFFVEKSMSSILKNDGLLGYIISDSWLNLDSFKKLRKILFIDNRMLQIMKMKNPFNQVSVSPVVFIAKKKTQKYYQFDVIDYDIDLKTPISSKKLAINKLKKPDLIVDLTSTEESFRLSKRIEENSIPLVKLANLQYGIMTADNSKFVLEKNTSKYCKPLLSGEDISRYKIKWSENRYIDYRPDEMKKKNTARPGEPERFEQKEKIVFQRYSSTRIIAALDTYGFYTLGTTIIAKVTDKKVSHKYVLGLINSKLLSWWYGRAYTTPTNYIREFERIPIRIGDKQQKEKIEQCVDELIKLHNSSKPDDQKEIEIKYWESEIDKTIYEIYNVTVEEIRMLGE